MRTGHKFVDKYNFSFKPGKGRVTQILQRCKAHDRPSNTPCGGRNTSAKSGDYQLLREWRNNFCGLDIALPKINFKRFNAHIGESQLFEHRNPPLSGAGFSFTACEARAHLSGQALDNIKSDITFEAAIDQCFRLSNSRLIEIIFANRWRRKSGCKKQRKKNRRQCIGLAGFGKYHCILFINFTK